MVTAGDNVTVTGSGSPANPYVVSAVTDCNEVCACISAGPGITKTGLANGCRIDAHISSTAGNNIVIDPGDQGLYVPTGAATVTAGCGLTGNGAAASPIRANTATWPFPCDLDELAEGVYCDASGVLRSPPPFRGSFASTGMNTSFPNTLVPTASDVNVFPLSVNITNNDTCRPAQLMLWQDVDVEWDLPPGSFAMAGIDGDDMVAIGNPGSITMFSQHVQASKLQQQALMAPGETRAVNMFVSMGRGAGGATYVRVQATMRIWCYSLT